MDQVTGFILRFRRLSDHGDIVEVFTKGCCYWFAYILCERFGGEMMYDPIVCHFAASIGGKIYDIRGDLAYVDCKYNFEPWCSFDDPIHKARIIRDCVLFTE